MRDERLTLNRETYLSGVAELVKGQEKIAIDCGVMEMSGEHLNDMMKIARSEGVTDFKLLNVCGQMLIGTGIEGGANIDVYGLMGNHSAAFMDQITLNTYPTHFPNGVWCPGDAQVAIGNTSNPTELNIGGSVDDIFAGYCPSGVFRVAGQGGNRCVLRGGAGIPQAWREIDYSDLVGDSKEETMEKMLYSYQQRKARLDKVGWDQFLSEFQLKVEDREPPVIVFGRKVRDYFMEYAQGTIGIILNVYGIESPVGYYACSGMTAGRAFIRGVISKDQLGMRTKFGEITEDDREFLAKHITEFYETFDNRLASSYQRRLNDLMELFHKNRDEVLDGFTKVVPEN